MRSIREMSSRIQCGHKRTKTITTAGMRWTVCQRCRSVTVVFVEDVFAEERKQLDSIAQGSQLDDADD